MLSIHTASGMFVSDSRRDMSLRQPRPDRLLNSASAAALSTLVIRNKISKSSTSNITDRAGYLVANYTGSKNARMNNCLLKILWAKCRFQSVTNMFSFDSTTFGRSTSSLLDSISSRIVACDWP